MKTQNSHHAFGERVKHQAELSRRKGVWSGMLEISALATVLGKDVHTIYPKQFSCACQSFMHTVYSPRQGVVHGSPIRIMWFCITLNISNEKCKLPNHFVPVLPVADPKINNICIKGQSVGQSLSPACMHAEFDEESISSWVEPKKQLKWCSPPPIPPSDSKKAKTKQSHIFSFLQLKQVASTATFSKQKQALAQQNQFNRQAPLKASQ